MRCVITGHTKNIGKALYDYFVKNNWEVIGLSRSSGYDVKTQYQEMLKIAQGADLFINNLCVGNCQIRFLNDLVGKVDNIISCGSIAGDFFQDLSNTDHCNYSIIKRDLKTLCKKYSLDYNVKTNILHLNISKAEEGFEDSGILLDDIVNAVSFWLDNTSIDNIEFHIPKTPYVKNKLKTKLGIIY